MEIPSGTLFNIVSFGGLYQFLFKSSKTLDKESFQTASDHVNSMKANMGGTLILQPLQEVLESPVTSGATRQLFIFTDGHVDNAHDEIFELLRQHSSTTRVFAFGIGEQTQKTFIKGMARAGMSNNKFYY
jgi:hypothetical protein